jgi:hypothetical protein
MNNITGLQQNNIKIVLYVIIFICCACLGVGCAPYYEAQKAYYEANAEIARRPMAEMTAPDGTKLVVNHQTVIQQASNPVVDTIKSIVSSPIASIIGGGWATREIVNAATGDNNSTYYQTTDNSATATPTIVNQPEPVVVSPADPVIVTQPEPIIVEQPKPIVVETGNGL